MIPCDLSMKKKADPRNNCGYGALSGVGAVKPTRVVYRTGAAGKICKKKPQRSVVKAVSAESAKGELGLYHGVSQDYIKYRVALRQKGDAAKACDSNTEEAGSVGLSLFCVPKEKNCLKLQIATSDTSTYVVSKCGGYIFSQCTATLGSCNMAFDDDERASVRVAEQSTMSFMFDRPQDITGVSLFLPPTGLGGTATLDDNPMFSLECLLANGKWFTVLDKTAVKAGEPSGWVRQAGRESACPTGTSTAWRISKLRLHDSVQSRSVPIYELKWHFKQSYVKTADLPVRPAKLPNLFPDLKISQDFSSTKVVNPSFTENEYLFCNHSQIVPHLYNGAVPPCRKLRDRDVGSMVAFRGGQHPDKSEASVMIVKDNATTVDRLYLFKHPAVHAQKRLQRLSVQACMGKDACTVSDTVATLDLTTSKQWTSPTVSGWIEFKLPRTASGQVWVLSELQGGTDTFYMFDFELSKGPASKLPSASDTKVNGWCVKNQAVKMKKTHTTPASEPPKIPRVLTKVGSIPTYNYHVNHKNKAFYSQRGNQLPIHPSISPMNMRYDSTHTYVTDNFKLDVLKKMPCDSGMQYRVELMFEDVGQISNGPMVAGQYQPGGRTTSYEKQHLNNAWRQYSFASQIFNVHNAKSPTPVLQDLTENNAEWTRDMHTGNIFHDELKNRGLWVTSSRLSGVRNRNRKDTEKCAKPKDGKDEVPTKGTNPHTCWKQFINRGNCDYKRENLPRGLPAYPKKQSIDAPQFDCTKSCIGSCEYTKLPTTVFRKKKWRNENSVGECIWGEKYCPKAEATHLASTFGVAKALDKDTVYRLGVSRNGAASYVEDNLYRGSVNNKAFYTPSVLKRKRSALPTNGFAPVEITKSQLSFKKSVSPCLSRS